MEPRNPTPLDDFLFDLRGYLVLENAVEPDLLAELNAAIDHFPDLAVGGWLGNAQRRDYTASTLTPERRKLLQPIAPLRPQISWSTH